MQQVKKTFETVAKDNPIDDVNSPDGFENRARALTKFSVEELDEAITYGMTNGEYELRDAALRARDLINGVS